MKAILAIIFAIPFLTWGSGKAIAFLLSKSALEGSPGISASMGSKAQRPRRPAHRAGREMPDRVALMSQAFFALFAVFA